MFYSRHQLSKYTLGVHLRQPPLVGDLGEELPTPSVLHDDVQLGQRLDDLVEPDDVGVVEALHGGDLTRQEPLGLLVEFGLVQDFYGHFFCQQWEGLFSFVNIGKVFSVLSTW